MAIKKTVILVHGWSVHHTSTYGELADRLEAESNEEIILDVKNIWLGKYISFHDEVRVDDISRAFESALRQDLDPTALGSKCICITHSTGGPVIRNWIWKFYIEPGRMAECPVSHLIMLAPANFGSALAILGKMRLGRIKSWIEGTEPGRGVLDWLELGSPESWDLNGKWMRFFSKPGRAPGFFPFVISGQSIDRHLYDHVNTYTGEMGSDGVVRLCAANLNAACYRFIQQNASGDEEERTLIPGDEEIIPAKTAFAIAAGRSHSGERMGILRSIGKEPDDHPTVRLILDCIRVGSDAAYATLCRQFDQVSKQVMDQERTEREEIILLKDRLIIHDPCSMLIFRIHDEYGDPIGNYDILFTGGTEDNENHLPVNFLVDKQRNTRAPGYITFYFNAGIMLGTEAVSYKSRELRKKQKGAKSFGFKIIPYTDQGFVHFLPGVLKGTPSLLRKLIVPNQTVLIDITMQRIVHEGVFRLTTSRMPEEFRDTPPGKIIPG